MSEPIKIPAEANEMVIVQCKDAFHLGLHLWSVFWSVYVSNIDPLDLKKQCFSLEKHFLKHGLSMLISMLKAIFDTILLPNMPQLGNIIQHNPPKDNLKSIKNRCLDRFFGHVDFILGAKLGPCWLLFR